MAPLRGRSLRERRLDARVPQGLRETLPLVAALRHDRNDAPWVIDGPSNGELIVTYVEQALAPTLPAGDIIILDNLGIYKGHRAGRATRAARAHLSFLPAFSPDLNLIERLFAKLKPLTCTAQPRTV